MWEKLKAVYRVSWMLLLKVGMEGGCGEGAGVNIHE
jgi:hypothetical protein